MIFILQTTRPVHGCAGIQWASRGTMAWSVSTLVVLLGSASHHFLMRGRKNLFFHHHFFQRHRGGYFSHDQGPAFGSKVITAANWKGRRGKGWCRKTYLNKQLNSSISVLIQCLILVFDLIGDKNSGHMLNPQPPFLQMIKKRTQDYYKVYYNTARSPMKTCHLFYPFACWFWLFNNSRSGRIPPWSSEIWHLQQTGTRYQVK